MVACRASAVHAQRSPGLPGVHSDDQDHGTPKPGASGIPEMLWVRIHEVGLKRARALRDDELSSLGWHSEEWRKSNAL